MSDGGAGAIGGMLEISVQLAKYPAGRAALLGVAGLLVLSGIGAQRSDTRAFAFMIALALILLVLPFFARSQWAKYRKRAKRRARLRELLTFLALGAVAVVAGLFLVARKRSSTLSADVVPSAAEVDLLSAQAAEVEPRS